MTIVDCYLKGEDVWINPVGGLGDMVIASSVMKLVHEKWPEIRFNVVKRNRFTSFFIGHPAVRELGHPPEGARIFGTLFWQDEEFFGEEFLAGLRPFQIIAKKFGLDLPVAERLYYPAKANCDIGHLTRYLPEEGRVVLLSVTSDCPRKQMHPLRWVELVKMLREEGIVCLQVGKDCDPYISGCVSLIGLTSPDQLYELLGRVDAVITPDNFVMHLAKAAGTGTVALWGPTRKEVYGYEGHCHIDAPGGCEQMEVCIGTRSPFGYRDDCDKPVEEKCMNRTSLNSVFEAVLAVLEGK